MNDEFVMLQEHTEESECNHAGFAPDGSLIMTVTETKPIGDIPTFAETTEFPTLYTAYCPVCEEFVTAPAFTKDEVAMRIRYAKDDMEPSMPWS